MGDADVKWMMVKKKKKNDVLNLTSSSLHESIFVGWYSEI